jgi:nucleoside-diphosphate-sugar epimerase
MSELLLSDAPSVLVTGGGGFCGRRTAGRLAEAGHQVRGIDLAADARADYEAIGAELVIGDLFDPDLLEAALDGVDLVVHTAARIGIEDDWAGFERTNVEGSRLVARAARRAGVGRFIQLSSVMVYGFDYPDGVTEDGLLDGAHNPYCQTKIDSELAVMAEHDPGHFDVFVIRPGDVYGPGCYPWVRAPIELMAAGLWFWLDPGDGPTPIHNHVYVDNLIDGIVAVVASGRSGEPFTITDDVRTPFREFFGHYEAALGLDLPVVTLDEARDLGAPPVWLSYQTRINQYSCAKARSVGYEPQVSLADGMAVTCGWARAVGLVGELG